MRLRTRQEHQNGILALARKHVAAGVDPVEAISKAGAEWREALDRERDAKIAYCLKRLGAIN